MVSIEGQGHFLTLTQSQLHMKLKAGLFSETHWANQSQILYVSFQVQGNEKFIDMMLVT